MHNEEIIKYITDERARGVLDADIRKELLAKGWKEVDIESVMGESTTGSLAAPLSSAGSLMGVGGLVSASWDEFVRHFALIAQIMAFPVVAYVISEVMLPRTVAPVAMMAGNVLSGIISLIGAILVVFASIGIMKQMRANWSLSVGDTYKVAMPYFWSFIWVTILSSLAIMGGMFLLIIPGIIVGIMLSFARPSVVLDDQKGMAALTWSGELVSGLWFPIFGRLLVMGILVVIVTILCGLFPYVSALSPLFTVPFSLIFMVLLYDNVKAFKGITPAQTVGKRKGMFTALAILGAVLIPLMFVAVAGLGLLGYWQNTHGLKGQVPLSGLVPGSTCDPMTDQNCHVYDAQGQRITPDTNTEVAPLPIE